MKTFTTEARRARRSDKATKGEDRAPDAGRMLLPYQAAFVRDASDIRVMVKSRRVGGTEAVAFETAYTRCFNERPRDLWFSSADESAAREFMERVKFYCRLFNVVVRSATGEVVVDERAMKIFEAHFPSGAKCVAMASTPKAFRSKGGDVVLDEFAFHEQPREMWAAAWPVATWGGRIAVLSTVNSDQDMFWSLVEQGRRRAKNEAKPGDMPVSLHEVYIDDAIGQGLVERVNAVAGTRFTREEFRARCRAGCDTQETFEREYLGAPSTQGRSLFPYADLRPLASSAERGGRVVGDIGPLLPEVERMVQALRPSAIYAGCDVGRRRDWFVLTLRGRVGGMLRFLGSIRFTGRNFAEMEQACAAVMGRDFHWWHEGAGERARCARLCIDATGMGMQLAERLEQRFAGRVEGITFTAAVKEQIATLARRHVEEKTIDLPEDDGTLAAWNSIRKTVTASGHARFDAEASDSFASGGASPGGHADEFWADALALHAGESAPAFYMGRFWR